MKAFPIPLQYPHKFSLLTPGKIKIPKAIQVPVFLIRHELQTRMLFNHFSKIGLEGCYLENFLDRLILASLGLWDGTDATNKLYFNLMNK